MFEYTITENNLNIPEENLFTIGKRANNPKRDFLFISKVLGKHLAVKPEVVKAAGYVLSSLKYNFNNAEYIDCLINKTKPDYENKAKDNVLVIGFCETATGLGMAVADSIEDSVYIHTTREKAEGMTELLTFEEEHSHASTHCLYSDFVKLEDFDHMILVDDEISTGNSMLNLIKQINQQCGCTTFDILTILDWRSESNLQKYVDFCKEYNITINVYSIIKGMYKEENPEYLKYLAPKLKLDYIQGLNTIDNFVLDRLKCNKCDFWTASGRFGVKYADIEKAEKQIKLAAKNLSILTKDKNILVLSEGESIYWPSRLAANLDCKNVDFRTTSLSPIYPDKKLIKDCHYYMQSDDKKYYFYNQEEAEGYDIVLFVSEKFDGVPELVKGMIKVNV